MASNPRRKAIAARIKPITFATLPYYLYRTALKRQRTFRSPDRPLTLQRVARSIHPRLAEPLFIIGAPRSGTTFLGNCIAALPEVSYHFEPVPTKAAARYVYEELWDWRRAKRFYRRVYSWLLRIGLDGDLILAEKTPRNCFIMPFLANAFPGARFIHIIRDGRDAALSLSERPWLQAAQRNSGRIEPGGYPYGPTPRFWVEPERRDQFENTTDLHRCTWSWRRHTEAAIAASNDLPPSQYLELRYEDLVRCPREQCDRILDFLRIANPKSRDALQSAAALAESRSVGRWRDHLTAEEVDRIMAEGGHLLRVLGYAETHPRDGGAAPILDRHHV